TLERAGRTLSITLTPDVREQDGRQVGFIGAGIAPFEWPEHMVRQIDYNPLVAIPVAVVKNWDMTVLTLDSLKKMVTGLVSAKHLSGPITIAKVAGASAKSGLESFLSSSSYRSFSLGLGILSPTQVLDGWHLVYFLAEWIRGKPLSERIQG